MQKTEETESRDISHVGGTIEDESIDKLVEADERFSDEISKANTHNIANRYKELKRTADTELTTATIRGAVEVTDKKVSLLVEHEGAEDEINVYKRGEGTPTIQDLFRFVSVDSFSDLWGETISIYPSDNASLTHRAALTQTSSKQKIKRKLYNGIIRTKLGGIATAEHPFAKQNSLVPTPIGIAALWGISMVSAVSVNLLGGIISTIPEMLLSNIAFSLLLFSISIGLVVSSAILFGASLLFTTVATGYLLTGDKADMQM